MLMLMLFYPFRSEELDLKEAGSYVAKLNNSDVMAIVNRNRTAFEPEGDLVELVLQNYHNDIVHNQDAFGQQENDEVDEMSRSREISEDEEERENVDKESSHETFTSN